MSRFTYARGVWTDGMTLPEIGDDEQHADYMARTGFVPVPLKLGVEYGSEIQLFEGKDVSGYFAVVQPMGMTTYDVHLPDFPSLMLFMKDYAAAFGSLDVQSQLQDLNEGMRRIFQVYHGHGLERLCKQCDPIGWQRAQDAQTRLTADRGTGGTVGVHE